MQGDSDHTTSTTEKAVGSGPKSPLQEALDAHNREWYGNATPELDSEVQE